MIWVNVLFGSLLPVLFFPLSLYHARNIRLKLDAMQLCSMHPLSMRMGIVMSLFSFLIHSTCILLLCIRKNRQPQQIEKHINKNPVYRPICIAVTPCVIAFRGQHWNYRFNQISRSIHLSLAAFFSHFTLNCYSIDKGNKTNIKKQRKKQTNLIEKNKWKMQMRQFKAFYFGQSMQLTKCFDRH